MPHFPVVTKNFSIYERLREQDEVSDRNKLIVLRLPLCTFHLYLIKEIKGRDGLADARNCNTPSSNLCLNPGDAGFLTPESWHSFNFVTYITV